MKYVHIALALALVGAVANAETSGPPVVVRGEAFPRRVETTVGVAREDQLDPNTGIPVSFEREQPIQTAAEGAAPALQVQLPIPQTAAEATPLQQAINNLRMDAALERSKAEETLRQAGDVGLAALIEWGLYHELPSVRTHSARLLGVWGGQRVLKYLVEAFYSAAFPTIPPYQVQYVATLDQQISNLTGQNFSFPVRRGSQAPEVANKTVLWWTANYEQLPQQLGE
ncbi:MAG TPA: hypothetical protein VEK08_21735, partial [Planctomycetota bacterium]|nr:hypothetical protein [Planctomycetota bacterium]